MDININSAQNVYQLPEIKVMVVGPSSGKTTWINNNFKISSFFWI
jgi:hypothetical protein